MALNKAAFFSKLGLPASKTVNIDGLGEVRVKPLTLSMQEQWEREILSEEGAMREDISIKASLIVKTVVDEEGRLIFNSDDIQAISELPAAPMNKLFTAAQELNNVTQDDIEELKKN